MSNILSAGKKKEKSRRDFSGINNKKIIKLVYRKVTLPPMHFF